MAANVFRGSLREPLDLVVKEKLGQRWSRSSKRYVRGGVAGDKPFFAQPSAEVFEECQAPRHSLRRWLGTAVPFQVVKPCRQVRTGNLAHPGSTASIFGK